ncbi:MAG: hypothetical protein K2L07_13635 [Lachnospiraceae bacterium]|nr:hypothetical protein [Lachnospiraceae bacterium]
MAYKMKTVGLMEAQAKAASYDYALLYLISEIKLCRTEMLKTINWEECQEARFFSADKELHIFEGENGMDAVEISDTGSDSIVIKEYLLDNRFASIGNSILVQEYLEYDEDGQAYVANTRLKGIC